MRLQVHTHEDNSAPWLLRSISFKPKLTKVRFIFQFTFYCCWKYIHQWSEQWFEVCQKPDTSEKEFQMLGLHGAMHSTGEESELGFQWRSLGWPLRLRKPAYSNEKPVACSFLLFWNSTVVVREDYSSFRFEQCFPVFSSENREDSDILTFPLKGHCLVWGQSNTTGRKSFPGPQIFHSF